MDKIADTLVDLFFEMAKEDRYGKPYKAEREEGYIHYEWVHNSEDGVTDYIYAELDFDRNEFFLDCMWVDGKPINTNNFMKFLVKILVVSTNYKKLNPATLAEIEAYVDSGIDTATINTAKPIRHWVCPNCGDIFKKAPRCPECGQLIIDDPTIQKIRKENK